jgi:cytochrome b561
MRCRECAVAAWGTKRLDNLFAVQLQRVVRQPTLEDASERYSGAAIALHWLTAVLIVTNLLLGLSMVALPISPRKLEWFLVHKSIGITVFLVTFARLAWRWYRPAPPPVAMPDWQRRSAAAAHALLYVLLVVIPISGWVYSSATGVQVVYLGLVPLPDLVPKDKALAGALRTTHVTLNFALFALLCVHVAAALKHHFGDRDAVLARMLPIVKPKETVE